MIIVGDCKTRESVMGRASRRGEAPSSCPADGGADRTTRGVHGDPPQGFTRRPANKPSVVIKTVIHLKELKSYETCFLTIEWN